MTRPAFHLDHLFARRRLSAYLDEDLDPRAQRRVRRHLVECEDCGRTERSLRRVVGGLRLLAGRRASRVADNSVARVRAER